LAHPSPAGQSSASLEPGNRALSHVVAARQFGERRRRASAFCAGVNFGGRPMCCPRFCARPRPSAVRVRIRSRSTSANRPNTAICRRKAARLSISRSSPTRDRQPSPDWSIFQLSRAQSCQAFAVCQFQGRLHHCIGAIQQHHARRLVAASRAAQNAAPLQPRNTGSRRVSGNRLFTGYPA
jgi:hypothetical protein